jgi:hypothetical protein
MSLAKIIDIPTLGQINIKIDEIADTASASNTHETTIVLSTVNVPSLKISGLCSINFKQLIQRGGGPFNGTCKINDGSALGCNKNIFTSLGPLIVSGNLDTTSHTISLAIREKHISNPYSYPKRLSQW